MNETFEDYCNRRGWSGYTEPLRKMWNDWRRDRECLIANMDQAEQQRDELQAKCDDLLAALKKYGKHKATCVTGLPEGFANDCTCGFSEAIAKARGQS